MRMTTMSLSWKIAGAAGGLVLVFFAWNGISRYVDDRRADEVTRDSASTAQINAQKASDRAREYQARLASDMEHQRQAMLAVHEEVREDSLQYQAAQAVRAEELRKQALRLRATYKIGPDQRCAAGIVFNHAGASFTTLVGSDGKPVTCQGDMAAQPLR